MFAHLIHDVSSEASGDGLRGEDAKVILLPIFSRAERPEEFRAAQLHSLVVIKRLFYHLRTRRWNAEGGAPSFEKRRPQCDMLRPGNRPVPGREILHCF